MLPLEKLTVHQLANALPLIEGAEFEEFKNDIKTNGQHKAIVFQNGVLIDGRNRWRACFELGIEPIIREHSGDPVEFIRRENVDPRRNLTVSQRAYFNSYLVKYLEADAEKRRKSGGSKSKGNKADTPLQDDGANLPRGQKRGRSSEIAAVEAGVSARTMKAAKAVTDKGVPGLGELVKSGKLAVSSAALVAKLPVEEQQALVDAGMEAIRDWIATSKEKPVVASRHAALPEEYFDDAGQPVPESLYPAWRTKNRFEVIAARVLESGLIEQAKQLRTLGQDLGRENIIEVANALEKSCRNFHSKIRGIQPSIVKGDTWESMVK